MALLYGMQNTRSKGGLHIHGLHIGEFFVDAGPRRWGRPTSDRTYSRSTWPISGREQSHDGRWGGRRTNVDEASETNVLQRCRTNVF